MNHAKLERPDLLKLSRNPNPRTINMVAIGDALLGAAPPIRALYVYNSNRSQWRRVGQGRERLLARDLFTVVHEQFFTDTCDYADIVLPATTQLEHYDVHTAYGTCTSWPTPGDRAAREALPNSEAFRRLAARMGFTRTASGIPTRTSADQAIESAEAVDAGNRVESLKKKGWQR